MKKVLLATTALAAVGFVAGAAHAVNVEMYGQVNKSALVYDDGTDTEFNVVDNDIASTRFGVKGSQALDNGLTASVLFEGEMQSTPSNSITQRNTAGNANTPTASTGTFTDRETRVGLGGDFGAVFLGRMATATSNVTEEDLGGVQDLMTSSVADIGGGLRFRRNSGAFFTLGGTNATVANFATKYGGDNIMDAVRYDTPIFYGWQGRVSAAQGGDTEASVWYDGKFDAFAVRGAVGYHQFATGATTASNGLDSQLSGSVSVKHDSGVAGTVAYGTRDLDHKAAGVDDPDFWYGKIGYAWDAFEVAADWGEFNDGVAVSTDQELQAFGLGAQYNMGHGVSLAALYRNYDADLTGISTDSINLYALNLRVKF